MPTHDYAIWGLRVRSELALDELPPAPADDAPIDIEIRLGTVDSPDDAVFGYSAVDDATLLNIADAGRYLIRGGREIVVDPDPDGCERTLRLFLLGSAFGALLHQRGFMPLHANAVVIDGRAVAFSGHSGAGKSTIAAWFHDRGFPVLTDDVCVIGDGADGRPYAFPGLRRLRLWREALAATGRTADDYPQSYAGADKFDVPMTRDAGEAVPMGAIYLLERAADGATAQSIERLRGMAAVDALVANTYRGGYLSTIGKTGRHLQACIALARAIPVFRVARLWGYDRFDEQAATLEAAIREELDRG